MMIDNSEKHSTKEYRYEEFHQLGLSDNQIEKVEEVISNYYLDYGVISSLKKIKDKNRKVSKIIENTFELINSIKSMMETHPNDYARLVKSITFGVNNFLLKINDSKQDNTKQWVPVKVSHEDAIKKRREMLSSEKELDCPAPLPYLEIMERSFSHHSIAHDYKGYNILEDEGKKEAIVFSLSPKKRLRSGVKRQAYSLHYKALYDLTVLWQVKFKNKIIKSDDSSFIKFLSIVFYGDISETESMRKYYRSNYNVKIEIYPIDSNEI